MLTYTQIAKYIDNELTIRYNSKLNLTKIKGISMFNLLKQFTKLMTIGLVAMLVACSNNGPEQVAKEFTEKMLTGDAEAVIALTYFSEDPTKSSDADIAKGKIKIILQEVKVETNKKGGVDKIVTDPATLSGDKKTAKVKVHVTFKNGDKSSNDINLIETKDGWKVK